MSPGADKPHRQACLLPLAPDPSPGNAAGFAVWDTPCSGLELGPFRDTVCQVHRVTCKGIAYVLREAELLAEGLGQGDAQAYEGLWREEYERTFIVASNSLRPLDLDVGAYEVLFQLVVALAIPSSTMWLEG